MAFPRISILMATWNRAPRIGRAVRSIQAQTFQDWELLIADDGSIDETPRVVAEWQKKESRIIVTKSETNQGISKNYNRGFKMARGKYIAMIDDDDPWCDDRKLQTQMDFLEEHSDYVGCGGGVIVIDQDGKELYRYLKPETDAEIRSYILFSNPMANSTTLFRRVAGERVGWYDEGTRYAGDYDFWLKMGRIGKLYNFPNYFSHYTMSGENTSITKIKPHLRAVFLIMRRYKRDYSWYPLAYVVNLVQYGYAFLPRAVRVMLHETLARLKRAVAG